MKFEKKTPLGIADGLPERGDLWYSRRSIQTMGLKGQRE